MFGRDSSFKGSVLMFLLFLSFRIFCQEIDPQIYNKNIEDIDLPEESNVDQTELTDNLLYFQQHQIDINTATESDFEKLGLLNCFKIAMILEYRQTHGSFLTIYELNGVEHLSSSDINSILPFVTVLDQKAVPKLRNEQQIILSSGADLPLKQGFVNDTAGIPKYPGQPFYTRIRYKASLNRLKFGFLAENDAGEPYFINKHTNIDYYSTFIQYNGSNLLNNLIVGDYYANFGQGLVISNGFASPGSYSSLQLRKLKNGFAPYTSMNENKFLRGVAFKLKKSYFSLSCFASMKKMDATQGQTDSLGNILDVTSFKTSGLHLMPSDMRDKDLLLEKSMGSNLNYEYENLRIGITQLGSYYDLPIVPENKPSNQFKFSGKRAQAGGIDFLYKLRKLEFAGEYAHTFNKGNAFTSSLNLQLTSDIAAAFQYRNFDADYYSPYANSFAKNPETNNEEGIFAGLNIQIISSLNLSLGTDYFKTKWISSLLNEPLQSHYYFIESTFSKIANCELSMRYTYVNKQVYGSPENIENTHKIRFQGRFKLNENVELRNRIESSFLKIQSSEEEGFMIYQDLIWRTDFKKLYLALRYAYFETDSWQSRIYTFENDMLYYYSFAPLYGKGSRFYALIRFSPLRKLNVTFRYGVLTYFDRQQIGTGAETIQGNSKTDLSCQLFIIF